ncbi:hypothetical protein V6N13_070301 [Hibiscus sabdariffa]|uniref:Transmembrane protein n=1 Tax=Hibiscus sabdariffa TaxID=183260 RepID=A0ABR2TGT4_9ROSI
MDSPGKQRLTLGLVVSFMSLCATRVSKKLKLKPKPEYQFGLRSHSPPKSTRPKQLLKTISNKAIKFVHRKMNGRDAEEDGVWQRAILMGDKCQPLDFSGAIYYDSKGNQVEESPFRSSRASPMPSYS